MNPLSGIAVGIILAAIGVPVWLFILLLVVFAVIAFSAEG